MKNVANRTNERTQTLILVSVQKVNVHVIDEVFALDCLQSIFMRTCQTFRV